MSAARTPSPDDEYVPIGDPGRVDLIVNRLRAQCGRCRQPAQHDDLTHACGAVFTHIVPMHFHKGVAFRLYQMRPDLIYSRTSQLWGRRVHMRPAPERGPNVIEQTDEDRRIGGLVYFIQHATGGAIKIGISSGPDYRLRNINASTHDPRYAFLATEHGGRAREAELHLRFAHLRMHGEWFQPEQDLLDYIAEVKRAV